MAIELNSRVVQPFGSLFSGVSTVGLTDRQLVERYASRRDEAAFAALVDRHGPAVLRACRAMAGDDHDAADAFQAVFLVLARRAGSIAVRDSLAPWLRDVARKVAAHARADAARRRRHEGRQPARAFARDREADDSGAVVREEVGRLPARYRAAVELCDLEGLTHEEAARHLGWPVGTVKSRQARGRDRLRTRLTARGLAPSALAALAVRSARAGVTPSLARATVLNASGAAGAGTVPAGVAALASGVLRTMLWNKLRTAGVLLATLLGVAGFGLRAATPAADEPAPAARRAAPDIPTVHAVAGRAGPLIDRIDDIPARAEVLWRLGLARSLGGDPDEAHSLWQEAWGLLRDEVAPEDWPHDLAVNLARAEADGGRLDVAQAMLRNASERAEVIDKHNLAGLDLWQAALQAQVDLGDREGAEATAARLRKLGEDDAFHSIVPKVELVLGEPDEALRAIAAPPLVGDEFARSVALSSLADWARDQDPDRVRWVLRAALPLAHAITDPEKRQDALGAFIAPLARSDDLALADRTVASLTDPARRVRAYAKLLGVALEFHNDPLAQRYLEQAEAAAGAIPDAEGRTAALNEIGSSLLVGGDEARARALAERLAPAARANVLVVIAQGEALRRKDSEDARTLARRVADEAGDAVPSDPNHAMQVFRAYMTLGEIPAAVRTIQGVTFEGARDALLAELADHEGRRGDPAAALEWIDALRSPRDRAFALAGLALGLARRQADAEVGLAE